MFKSYFKIAFRTLWKHKTFSAINLVGLAVSIAVCLLLIAFIRHQQRFDQFHSKADRIYRVITEMHDPQIGVLGLATTPAPLAKTMRENNSQIAATTQLRRMGMNASFENTVHSVSGAYAEPSFFELFDFPLVSGDVATALHEPFSVVLSQKLAQQIFGAANPVGKVLVRDSGDPYRVTGVMHDFPSASHLQFEALVSYATLNVFDTRSPGALALNDWQYFTTTYTYLLLDENARLSEVRKGLELQQNRYDRDKPNEFGQTVERFDVQKLSEINLGRELSNEIAQITPGIVVYVLSVLAAIIMLIACFNYISLSIARSLKRAREVGVRKVAGAWRRQLVTQFLSESVIIALLAMALGSILLVELIPAFNKLGFIQDMKARITFEVLSDPWLYLSFFGFSLLTGVLAGLFPAFALSAYRPVNVLKGLSRISGFSGLTLRRTLIVIQFSLALIFIIITGFIHRQIGFMLAADYGFNRDHLVFVELQSAPYERFRQEMLKSPTVASVSASSAVLVGGQTWQRGKTAGMESNLLVGIIAIDEHFIDDFGLTILAGRNFDPAFSTDQQGVILSEKAVQEFGFQSPQEAVGETVILEETNPHTVLGVVKEFYFRPLSSSSRPLALKYDPSWFQYAAIRFHGEQLPQMLDHLRATWGAFDQAPPLQYVFFDDHLETEYAAMRDATRILSLAAGFAVLIACLGLLGMVIYAVETRTQEIGVRKVLGADVPGLIVLLSQSFLRLLIVAITIAAPLCFLLIRVLSQNFAQGPGFELGLFVWPILGLLSLAILTIGSQTIKAALANPVKSLRYE